MYGDAMLCDSGVIISKSLRPETCQHIHTYTRLTSGHLAYCYT